MKIKVIKTVVIIPKYIYKCWISTIDILYENPYILGDKLNKSSSLQGSGKVNSLYKVEIAPEKKIVTSKYNIVNTQEDRAHDSLLNIPQNSFGSEWIEREIEGLDGNCYASGSFASRFITMLMTNLITETAVETTLIESNNVNTVYFNMNENNQGCLPSYVSKFFTNSCV